MPTAGATTSGRRRNSQVGPFITRAPELAVCLGNRRLTQAGIAVDAEAFSGGGVGDPARVDGAANCQDIRGSGFGTDLAHKGFAAVLAAADTMFAQLVAIVTPQPTRSAALCPVPWRDE